MYGYNIFILFVHYETELMLSEFCVAYIIL